MFTDIRHNIVKIYIIQAIRWFMLFIPVLVLFFQENGLSMQEVFLLQTAFSLLMIVSEIPSGYFSDVLGRRRTMIFGTVASAFGFVVYCLASGFWGFFVAEMILGLGASLVSGTDSALLYDTLSHLERENEYIQKEGRLVSIGNFSEGTASVIGGLLAVISLRMPLYVEAVIALLSIPVAWSLVEPPRHTYDASRGNMRAIMDIVQFALHGNREVKWLILYSSVVGASTLTMVWFIQPYLKLAGLPVVMFGIVWASLQYFVGFFSLSAHTIEQRVGKKTVVLSLIFLSVLGYILLGMFQSLWAAVFILLFYFVRGIASPMFKGYINALISSDKRATILSVQQMVIRMIFAAVGPFLGWISDLLSFSTAMFSAALIFLVLGIVTLVFAQRHGILDVRQPASE
jgi:predicted MFS family arabinose efflux permease